MNTFLPYESFETSARVLDTRRLGKQRIEVLQMLRAIHGETTGWRNHPAVTMWLGHGRALACYGIACCNEWIRRGFKDTTKPRLEHYFEYGRGEILPPDWTQQADVLLAYRSNLVRKDPKAYGVLWPTVRDDLPYVWPAGCSNINHHHNHFPKQRVICVP